MNSVCCLKGGPKTQSGRFSSKIWTMICDNFETVRDMMPVCPSVCHTRVTVPTIFSCSLFADGCMIHNFNISTEFQLYTLFSFSSKPCVMCRRIFLTRSVDRLTMCWNVIWMPCVNIGHLTRVNCRMSSVLFADIIVFSFACLEVEA